jgi:hypothetical protein
MFRWPDLLATRQNLFPVLEDNTMMFTSQRHANRTDKRGRESEKSSCEKTYQCRNCRKILEKSKRKPEDHRCGEWKCKNSTTMHLTQVDLKPRNLLCALQVRTKTVCNSSRSYTCCICCNPRYIFRTAVLLPDTPRHTISFWFVSFRSRRRNFFYARCRVVKKNAVVPTCNYGCGYRQRIFRGIDAVVQFCDHIMTPHYNNTVLIGVSGSSMHLTQVDLKPRNLLCALQVRTKTICNSSRSYTGFQMHDLWWSLH